MRASDIAYQSILDKLLNGEFRCGQAIEEKAMIVRLNTSKTPLREAILRLTQEGYIENSPNRGMNFVNLGIADIQSLLGLRTTLMPHLAASLIANCTDKQIKTLEDYIESIKDELFINDLELHRMLNSFSDDKYLISMLGKLESLSMIALRHFIVTENPKISSEAIYNSNMRLVIALKERDIEKLTQALKNHIPRYIMQYGYN